MYFVENIKFIYTSFDEFFLPVSQRVEMNYIFSDNVRILYLSPQRNSNCLKRTETRVVLILFDCVLCEVRAYKHKSCYYFLPSLNTVSSLIYITLFSIRNKNCLWRPCLSTDRDEMSNLYRRPSIVASYQVSVFIVSSFSEIICTEFVCLYTYEFWLSLWKIVRSSVILLLYYIHIHLAKQFERRRFYKIGQLETQIACGDHVC
jgi:hypothetical protein